MSEAAIVEPAPAKINLALHVTGRRADGYHLLDTLVAFCEAGDRVQVRSAARDSFTIEGPFAGFLPTGPDNLVLRARDLARRLAGAAAAPVAIELEKNLPVASGIGGGSSDAAATLRALTRLWRITIPEKELAGAALALGADLPMCLAARTLHAGGIGESIAKVRGLPPLAMVLANPGVAVATPAVFVALAERNNPPLGPLPRRPGFSALVEWLGATRNDLEGPATTVAPAIGDAIAALRGHGAALARMSGSGATCFGLFASDAAARAAADALAAARPSWYVRATRTIEEAEPDGDH